MEMKIEEVWTLLNSQTFLIVSMILVSKVSSVKEVCGGGTDTPNKYHQFNSNFGKWKKLM